MLMRALAILLTLSGAMAAEAQDTRLAAAGVLDRNGTTDCSGVLIAPDLVVTAGHCATGKAVADEGGEDRIVFRTGAYPGRPSTDWQVSGLYVHPMAHGSSSRQADGLSHDAAILKLAAPVPPEIAVPVPISDRLPEPGEKLLLATWPGGAGQRARERRCPVVSSTDALMILECRVIPGESGGAALRLTGTGPELVGIVVAKASANGRPAAFALPASRQILQIRGVYLD